MARKKKLKPGIYDMAAAVYHTDPCQQPSLSSSVAKLLINQSPAHAWTAHPRLNPGYVAEERSDFDFGTAAHEALLQGLDRVHVINAEDWRKQATRDERDDARLRGFIPVLASKAPAIKLMVNQAVQAIANCPDLSGITLADGKPEQTIIWNDGDAWCRARLDWLANDYSLILDYKTTSASAEPSSWIRSSLITLGGDVQAAFYLYGLQKLSRQLPRPPSFVFLVQEIEPPYACSFIGMPPAFLALGDQKVADAIRTWQDCMKRGTWPAYSPRICWPDPLPWMEARYMERSTSSSYDQLQEKEGLQA